MISLKIICCVKQHLRDVHVWTKKHGNTFTGLAIYCYQANLTCLTVWPLLRHEEIGSYHYILSFCTNNICSNICLNLNSPRALQESHATDFNYYNSLNNSLRTTSTQ